MPSMRDANSDAISQHLPCKVTNKLAHRQGKGKRDDSEWRVASGEWRVANSRGERRFALNSHDGRRQRMASSEWRLVKRRLPVGVAISHDKNGGQVGSRQIGRSENGSE
jgi:hypothetical protein